MSGASAENLRRQLFACVHELGHGFNLKHCWQKTATRPPLPSRPEAASWMNYPDRFTGGDKAFWPAFAFEFDDVELAHLRHGFRDDVIMGGAPFLSSAGLSRTPDWDDREPNAGDPSMRLTLQAPRVLGYGVPVTVDFELASTSRAGRYVPTVLGPRSGTVDIAIQRPDGETLGFDPLLRHCRGHASRLLRAGDLPVRDSAFLHYGRNGYAFSEPGTYRLRARYAAPDGAITYSPIVPIRIRAPRSPGEAALGELSYAGDEVGALMSVVGSDSALLRRGNDAMQEIIERFPRHPTAAVSRLVLGANAAREFKTISSAGRLSVREPDLALARTLVDPVVDVERLESTARRAARPTGARRELATALPVVGARHGIDGSVVSFIRSRRDEIAAEVPAIAYRAEHDITAIRAATLREPVQRRPSTST